MKKITKRFLILTAWCASGFCATLPGSVPDRPSSSLGTRVNMMREGTNGKELEMVTNPLRALTAPSTLTVPNLDHDNLEERLNSYFLTHLDAPFSKKELGFSAFLGAALAYGGAQGVAPSTYLFIDWAFPDGFYYALTLSQQKNIDAFSLDTSHSLAPFLGLYGLARGYDFVNRTRYAIPTKQFADLFAPAKKLLATAGYTASAVISAALAANQVSLYYKLGEKANFSIKGTSDVTSYTDQFLTLAIYIFCESFDQMASKVAGFARPSSKTARKKLLEKLAQAAKGINELDADKTIEIYERFKNSDTEPLKQVRLLMECGKEEKLSKTLWYEHLYGNAAPLVVAAFAGYAQWQFALQLPTRFDVLPNTTLDQGIGYTSAILTTLIKGGSAFLQTKAMGQYLHDVFTCKRENQTPRSTRRSRFYEVSNALIPTAYASLLALSVGLNIYFQIDANAMPDQEYDSRRQWIISIVSAYTLAEIANQTVRLAQGNGYLPEVAANIKTRLGKIAARASNAVASALPEKVTKTYATAKTTMANYTPNCIASVWSRVKQASGYAADKVTYLLTGRKPGEKRSETEQRSKMIDRIEQAQYIAQAGTEDTVNFLEKYTNQTNSAV